ncbi:chitinase [Streptomyces asiaticus]|uniref:chitinase n=1 Tax=Streptomyces asiaticus TaxID=114695 RepID=UPI001BA44D6E|nr:chitinase [Streptomyces asiaticus]
MRASPRMSGIAVAGAVVCATIAVWAGHQKQSPEPHAAPSQPRASQPPAARPPAEFVPYVNAWSDSGYDMAAAASRGVKEFSLGFVVADDGCTPVWDGGTSLEDQGLEARIEGVRRAGGDVRISFGGAEGTELATVCTDVPELASAYAEVIERYQSARIDFDLEGEVLADTEAAARRAQALALIQRTHEGLNISFTLPAMPDGLTPQGVAQLEAAKQEGVILSGVNIMAMNYSGDHTGDMGDYAVQAATAAQARIREVFGMSDAAAWKILAVTPMIGVNDVTGETFTLEDAAGLARFAAEKGIGRLSMWSAERDQPCTPEMTRSAIPTAPTAGAAAPEPTANIVPNTRCSGVTQRPGAFEAALRG